MTSSYKYSSVPGLVTVDAKYLRGHYTMTDVVTGDPRDRSWDPAFITTESRVSKIARRGHFMIQLVSRPETEAIRLSS